MKRWWRRCDVWPFAGAWRIVTLTFESRPTWRWLQSVRTTAGHMLDQRWPTWPTWPWLQSVRTTAGHMLDQRCHTSGNCSLVERLKVTRLPKCQTLTVSLQARALLSVASLLFSQTGSAIMNVIILIVQGLTRVNFRNTLHVSKLQVLTARQ